MPMKLLNRLGEVLSANEPHRVPWPPVLVALQGVDRRNAGMLQAGGDFGLAKKPLPDAGVVRQLGTDFLQSHFASELCIAGHGHAPLSAFAVWPQHFINGV